MRQIDADEATMHQIDFSMLAGRNKPWGSPLKDTLLAIGIFSALAAATVFFSWLAYMLDADPIIGMIIVNATITVAVFAAFIWAAIIGVRKVLLRPKVMEEFARRNNFAFSKPGISMVDDGAIFPPESPIIPSMQKCYVNYFISGRAGDIGFDLYMLTGTQHSGQLGLPLTVLRLPHHVKPYDGDLYRSINSDLGYGYVITRDNSSNREVLQKLFELGGL